MSPGCITLASAFISRSSPGSLLLSDFLGCVTQAQNQLRFPRWNEGACKV
jgi:hypothetical protein